MDKQRFYINLDCCSIRQKNTGLGHLTILKFTLLINSIQILDQSNLRRGYDGKCRNCPRVWFEGSGGMPG